MSHDIYDIYADTVNYAQRLEEIVSDIIGDEYLKELRKKYIKPATNVAVEWLKEDSK
jgi:hypothetical protein